MSSVLLSVKLRGEVSGSKKHTTKQIVTVDVTKIGSKYSETMTKNILHTDREESDCVRKMRISEETVADWERSECPYWEKPSQWKTKTKSQKLMSHLNRYDEGYGIIVDFVN